MVGTFLEITFYHKESTLDSSVEKGMETITLKTQFDGLEINDMLFFDDDQAENVQVTEVSGKMVSVKRLLKEHSDGCRVIKNVYCVVYSFSIIVSSFFLLWLSIFFFVQSVLHSTSVE